MIPTRNEISEKLKELTEQSPENKVDIIRAWLETCHCPSKDLEKILSDLNSYPEYVE